MSAITAALAARRIQQDREEEKKKAGQIDIKNILGGMVGGYFGGGGSIDPSKGFSMEALNLSPENIQGAGIGALKGATTPMTEDSMMGTANAGLSGYDIANQIAEKRRKLAAETAKTTYDRGMDERKLKTSEAELSEKVRHNKKSEEIQRDREAKRRALLDKAKLDPLWKIALDKADKELSKNFDLKYKAMDMTPEERSDFLYQLTQTYYNSLKGQEQPAAGESEPVVGDSVTVSDGTTTKTISREDYDRLNRANPGVLKIVKK